MTTEKKQSLTPEEEVKLQQHFELCMKIGTSVERADRATAETALTEMYRITNRPQPQYLWFSSPASACLGFCVLRLVDIDDWTARVRKQLFDKGPSAARPPFKKEKKEDPKPLDAIMDALKASFQDLFFGLFREALFEAIVGVDGKTPKPELTGAQQIMLETAATAEIDYVLTKASASELSSLLGEAINSFLGWGQWDQFWVGFYEFMPVIGVKFPEDSAHLLKQWGMLSRSMGWWAPFKEVVIACDRPIVCKLNDRRVMHATDGPALKYTDGWEVHSINGVRVPKHFVEAPETITLQEIVDEKNQEIRRIGIERWGWPKYLEAAGATVVDHRKNDIEGTEETLMRTNTETVLVCACPSTSRVYSLEVPPTTQTCEAAQAYLSSGLSGRTIAAS